METKNRIIIAADEIAELTRDEITVRSKQDSRGPDWAARKADAQHTALASKADRATAQREARRAARAERKANRAA